MPDADQPTPNTTPPYHVPAAPILAKDGISWVASGRVEDQPDAELGTVWKAYHAMQDARGLWYITAETMDGDLVIDAVDIHHQEDVVKELRGTSRNLPGIEVHIDPIEREEARGYTRDRTVKPQVAKRAKAARKANR